MKIHERKFSILLWILLMTIGAVYFLTLAPTVTQIDTGELAAVQAALGIAHPTGYPLFTVLGNLFLKIPLFQAKIRQLNFLAMLWCIAAIWLFILSVRMILRSVKKEPSVRIGLTGNGLFAVGASALFLAFSRNFWVQSTYIDVFSLHLLLMGSVLFFSFRCLLEEKPTVHSWIVLSFFTALSFSNHMSSIFILPGLLYCFIVQVGIRRSGLKTLVLCAAVFWLAAIAFYAYLPVRASQDPAFNWGDPVNWANFFRHVSGRQYSVWMFKSSEAAWTHLDEFLNRFPSEFTWFGLILGFIGIVSTLVQSPRLFIFLALAYASAVLYSVNYDIHDLESYFLLADVVFAFWIALGVKTALDSLKKAVYLKTAVLILIAVGVFSEAFSNFKKNDLSRYYIFEDYSKQALDSLPENAVLITYQWDYLVSPAYYFQSVEHWRKDVAVIDKELLRRSWYFKQLETNFPGITQKVKPEVSAFLEALRPFETGGHFNPQLLDRLYTRLIQRLIETNLKGNGVFLGPELMDKELQTREVVLPENTRLVPDLFFYRVVPSDSAYHPLRMTGMHIRFPKTENAYTGNVKQFTARMLMQRMMYEASSGMENAENQLKRTAADQFPEIQFPETLR